MEVFDAAILHTQLRRRNFEDVFRERMNFEEKVVFAASPLAAIAAKLISNNGEYFSMDFETKLTPIAYNYWMVKQVLPSPSLI